MANHACSRNGGPTHCSFAFLGRSRSGSVCVTEASRRVPRGALPQDHGQRPRHRHRTQHDPRLHQGADGRPGVQDACGNGRRGRRDLDLLADVGPRRIDQDHRRESQCDLLREAHRLDHTGCAVGVRLLNGARRLLALRKDAPLRRRLCGGQGVPWGR